MITVVARWIGRLVLLATMLIAGGHFVYYLYHWEWVRAQIAGIAFLTAMIIAATSVVLRRLDRMEREVRARLDALPAGSDGQSLPSGPRAPVALPRQRSDAGGRPHHADPEFPWLAPALAPPGHRAVAPLAWSAPLAAAVEMPDTAVFIPILLGAGLAVSAVAGLVERMSASVHGDTATRMVTAVVAGAVAVVLIGLAVGGIWRVAHYRPAPFGDGRTELTVQVSTQAAARPAEQTVSVMGRYCARSAISRVTVEQVRPATSDTAVLVVSPVLDEQAVRRYSGCLQDANLERHRLTVISTTRLWEAQP